jgi:DNA polymerase-1
MRRLTTEQLLAEQARYQAILANSSDPDQQRVARARLQEIERELAHREGRPGAGARPRGNRWPQVDLVALLRESGCTLREKAPGKWVGDHPQKHGSKSGECLVVWPAAGRWHCTSCKAGGDAADWVAHLEGISYAEAAAQLEARFGARPQPAAHESQATRLVRLGREAELWHDPDGTAWATIDTGDHREHWPLRSSGFRDWLSRRFYETYGHGPNAQAVQDALAVLAGEARYAGPEYPVFVRLAEHAGTVYLDLADPHWRAVEITAHGWRIVHDPPVRFRRARGMQPLPEPQRGGDIRRLWRFVRVLPSDRPLVLGWLVMAFRPRGPYPVLPLQGEQGSGKSTAARVLRRLIDPNKADLRAEPKEARDLWVAAYNSWVVALDNVSKLPPWLADGLCRLATGAGFASRTLYEDAEETILDAQRPVVLTSIRDVVAASPDLLDRAVLVQVPRLPDEARESERCFWAAFEREWPALLGALLDLVSQALARVESVRLDQAPRMADFAEWCVAAFGDQGGAEFLAAYLGNRSEAATAAIEGSPVAEALLAFMAGRDVWQGTASELLAALDQAADEETRRKRERAPAWPKTARELAGELRRLAPALRAAGLEMTWARVGHNRVRQITLEKAGKRSSASSASSAPACFAFLDADFAADDRRADADDMRTMADDDEPTDRPQENGRHDADSAAPRTVADGADGGFPSFSEPLQYRLVQDTQAVMEALPQLRTAPVIGLDTETTGLDPFTDRLRLVQLAVPDGPVYLIDCFAVDPRLLAPLFAAPDGPTFVGHNLAFDLRFLIQAGLPVPPGRRLFDTMLATQVLDETGRQPSLAEIVRRFLDRDLPKALQTADWGGPLSPTMLDYAARDAAVLLPLFAVLTSELETAGLLRVLKLESRALPAVVWLAHAGAPFDSDAWRAVSDAAYAEQLELAEELAALATDLLGPNTLFGHTVNWDSAPQVLAILKHAGLDVADTREETLARYREHPLVAKLLAYREAAKRAGTYGLDWLRFVHPLTGRIHADWRQIGAASGRMACTRPNLQNIPRDPRYRACFRPGEGRLLVKADYSQIELRIAAELAGDARMLAAFAAGEDLHTVTASLVLGKAPDAVTKEDRQLAKAVNFGLLYGMGPAAFADYARTAYGLTLTTDEAKTLRDRFFAAYPGLKRWHRSQPDGAVAVRTASGRRRVVERFTEKLNTPVQGTGADGLKLALALLWETRHQCPSAVPVLAVHDEVVIECDADEAERARDWLVDCMQRGMQQFLRRVPVAVEALICRDWSGTPV